MFKKIRLRKHHICLVQLEHIPPVLYRGGKRKSLFFEASKILGRLGSWEVGPQWNIVWGWEWRIASVVSRHYNDSKCVCDIFDLGVEKF